MTEIILTICLIVIIVPVLLILLAAWNLKRKMQGLGSGEGFDALKEFFKNLENERNKQNSQKTESKKAENRNPAKVIKQSGKNVEDAEFYEPRA